MVIAGNSDGIFKRLMQAIGRADLAADPALGRNEGRVQHIDTIDRAIGEWTSRHELDEVLAALRRADVPVGKIYTAADIHRDAQYRARDMIEHATLPDGAAVDLPGIVPKLSDTPGTTKWLGPTLGEHVEQVLGSLGIAGAALDDLRARGIV